MKRGINERRRTKFRFPFEPLAAVYSRRFSFIFPNVSRRSTFRFANPSQTDPFKRLKWPNYISGATGGVIIKNTRRVHTDVTYRTRARYCRTGIIEFFIAFVATAVDRLHRPMGTRFSDLFGNRRGIIYTYICIARWAALGRVVAHSLATVLFSAELFTGRLLYGVGGWRVCIARRIELAKIGSFGPRDCNT